MSFTDDFKSRTNVNFNRSAFGYAPEELESMIKSDIQSILDESDIHVQILDLAIYGSRSRGLEHTGSDLDIVVEYSGNEREDHLFNVLHAGQLDIHGIAVDINPINKEQSGTLEQYLISAEQYLEIKSNHRRMSHMDKFEQARILQDYLEEKGYTDEPISIADNQGIGRLLDIAEKHGIIAVHAEVPCSGKLNFDSPEEAESYLCENYNLADFDDVNGFYNITREAEGSNINVSWTWKVDYFAPQNEVSERLDEIYSDTDFRLVDELDYDLSDFIIDFSFKNISEIYKGLLIGERPHVADVPELI